MTIALYFLHGDICNYFSASFVVKLTPTLKKKMLTEMQFGQLQDVMSMMLSACCKGLTVIEKDK